MAKTAPNLATSLTNEAKALRRLGRNDEADQLEQRLAKINRTTAHKLKASGSAGILPAHWVRAGRSHDSRRDAGATKP